MSFSVVPRQEDASFTVEEPNSEQNVVWGVAPLFDFSTGEFLIDSDGNLMLGNEAETFEQDIRMALVIDRTRYPAVSPDFGSDFWIIRGRQNNDPFVVAMASAFTREAIQTDDRIERIVYINPDPQGDILYIDIGLITKSGKTLEFTLVKNFR